MGLKNVKSRLNYLNGTMEIDSGEKGTTIMINIPYKEKHA
jgi:signal transduction histidine kinase